MMNLTLRTDAGEVLRVLLDEQTTQELRDLLDSGAGVLDVAAERIVAVCGRPANVGDFAAAMERWYR